MSSPLLSLRSIFKSHHGVQILRGVDLDVNPGEFFTLLGPLGCGNTAIISVVAGYKLPDRGQIILDSKEITRLPVEKRNIGTVIPEAFIQQKTVHHYIADGLRAHGISRRDAVSRAKELMDQAGISADGSNRLCDIPGNRRLAASITRTAAPLPDILLLDEPFQSLDYAQRRLMIREIRLLQRKLGITFICSMENADDALAVSDRIALMNDGRVIQTDTPQALYNQLQTEFAAVYLGCSNLLRGIASATGSGRVLLNVGGLTFPCMSSEPVALEQKMCLCIYAERLHFGINQQGDIHLSGIVRENHFEGSMRRTILELPTGQLLTAQRPSDEPNEFLPGQRVFIWWNIKDAALVEDAS